MFFADHKPHTPIKQQPLQSQPYPNNPQQQLPSIQQSQKGRDLMNTSSPNVPLKGPPSTRGTNSNNVPMAAVSVGHNVVRPVTIPTNSDANHKNAVRPIPISSLSNAGQVSTTPHKSQPKVDPSRVVPKDMQTRGPIETVQKLAGNANPIMYGNTNSNIKGYSTTLPQYNLNNSNNNHIPPPVFASSNTALQCNPKVDNTNDAIRNMMHGPRNYANLMVRNLIYLNNVQAIIWFIINYSNHRHHYYHNRRSHYHYNRISSSSNNNKAILICVLQLLPAAIM